MKDEKQTHHPAKERCDETRVDRADVEALTDREVRSGDVVDVQLDAETRRVLNAEKPRVDVREADLHRVLGRLPLKDPRRVQRVEVTPGRVVREQAHQDGYHARDEGGDGERETPRVVHAGADHLLEERVDADHEHLRDAAAEVAPASSSSVGHADDVGREELRRPELRHDEGGAAEAGECCAGSRGNV